MAKKKDRTQWRSEISQHPVGWERYVKLSSARAVSAAITAWSLVAASFMSTAPLNIGRRSEANMIKNRLEVFGFRGRYPP